MAPHQQRVFYEKKDLDEKRSKLLEFFNTELFRSLDQAEKDRLRSQHGVMGVYSEILHQRLAALSEKEITGPKCVLCGQLMPPGEEMFQYHGFSGPCPHNA